MNVKKLLEQLDEVKIPNKEWDDVEVKTDGDFKFLVENAGSGYIIKSIEHKGKEIVHICDGEGSYDVDEDYIEKIGGDTTKNNKPSEAINVKEAISKLKKKYPPEAVDAFCRIHYVENEYFVKDFENNKGFIEEFENSYKGKHPSSEVIAMMQIFTQNDGYYFHNLALEKEFGM